MDPIPRRIAVAAAIVLGASAGGYALGSFAIAPDSRAVSRTGAQELEAEDAVAHQAPVHPAERDVAPKGYVCQGCDARTTNEAAMADDFQPFDSAPLPPYRPPPDDIAAAADLPVIAADRGAPDRMRRGAGEAQAAAARLPVLAADRPSADSPAPSNAMED